MSRTPYSPFVLNATAPEPWNAGRWGAMGAVGSCVSGGSSIPSDFVGIVRRAADGRQRAAPRRVVTRVSGRTKAGASEKKLRPPDDSPAVSADGRTLRVARGRVQYRFG